jgi:tRNA(fMet)-specific endonuclease VapC
MSIVIDTNILIAIVRSKNATALTKYLGVSQQRVYVSIVTEAEIKSFAIKNNWGRSRLNILEEFLEDVNIIEVDRSYVNIYAQIDSFSQRLNPNFTSYNFNTPRNMGKNDLWIASLASLLGLTLVTTDSDFDHLNGIFFDVRKIKPDELMAFL